VARTRYGLVGVIARRNYLDGSGSDDCKVEVSVAERLAIDGRDLHFAGGIPGGTVGKG